VLYEQEVVTPGAFLAAATRVARPVLVANHGWMMRGGRRGMLRAASRWADPVGSDPRHDRAEQPTHP
jgi:hypothetical protein